MTLWRRLAAALVLAAALIGARAQGADEPWRFGGTLYLWFPTVSGETQYPPPANGVSIGLDAADYLNALEFVFMGALEARKGRYGVLSDFIYLDFGADKSGSRDFTLTGPGGLIQLPAGASGDVKLDLKGWAWSLVGTYALVQKPNYEMLALGGARYLKLDTTVDWRLTGNVGSLPAAALTGSSSSDPHVWDMVVGAKGRARFGDGSWYVPYYVDIGTGQSDLTWQALIGLGYSFSWGDLSAVYRHLDYEFDSSPAKNLSFSGPAVAATFRW